MATGRAHGPGRAAPVAATTMRWPLVALIGLGLVLSGCGNGDPDGGVTRAESEVAAKQEALTQAQSKLAAASAEFCQDTASYLMALDRYGDVVTETAVTVGDVKDAGSDLMEPREDTGSSGQDVMDAKQDVAAAEQELAEAEAALAAARAASSLPTPSAAPATAPPTSPTPALPTATVDRVKQAEADFAAAREGISDQTPLTEASQQFNAAVVALQLSWLRLFAEAGCLTGEQQKQAEAAVHDYTAALQQSLATAGYYQDKIDGIYGPATVAAVQSLQEANSLPVTGTVDTATDAALQAELLAKGDQAAQQAVASTAALQQTLRLAGYWTGPVDGQWTPALTEALKSCQTALGVEPTGTVDAATVLALQRAIAEATQPAPATGTTPATGTAPPTQTS